LIKKYAVMVGFHLDLDMSLCCCFIIVSDSEFC